MVPKVSRLFQTSAGIAAAIFLVAFASQPSFSQGAATANSGAYGGDPHAEFIAKFEVAREHEREEEKKACPASFWPDFGTLQEIDLFTDVAWERVGSNAGNVVKPGNVFPQVLKSEKLQKIFADQIRRNWLSTELPNSACKYPKLIIADSRYVPQAEISPKNVLRIVVKVEVEEETNPQIAILSVLQTRPDFDHHGNSLLVFPWIKAIPLNLPEGDVVRIMADTVNRIIQRPFHVKIEK